MEEQQRFTTISLIKPIIFVNQFLGIFPYDLSDNTLKFSWISVKLFRTVLNLVILSLYFLYLSCEFIEILISGKGILLLVKLHVWMAMTFIPILILLLSIFKRHQFTFFFERCNQMRELLSGFVGCPHAVHYAWKLYSFYFIIAIISSILVGWDAVRNPKSIISILQFVEDPTQGQIIFNCIFQTYISLITSASFSFIEILCPSLARSLTGSLVRIRNQLFEDTVKTIFPNSEQENQNDVKTVTFVNMKPKPDLCTGNNYCATKPIMKAMERYNLIAQKQDLIDSIFGSILALNTAWLVLSVCLLSFQEIRYFNPSAAKGYDLIVINSSDFNIVVIIWNCCSLILRLGIVLVCLSNTFHASQCVGHCIMNALVEMNVTPKNNDLQIIQIHLLSQQMKPLGFSAGGFFVFSRGAILYCISIITTYLVFLLQA